VEKHIEGNMHEHQQARQQFIEEREVFADTKTPEQISLKILEEVGEFLSAYSEYARHEPDAQRLQAVKEEAADVVHLLLDVAIWSGFDLGEAMQQKLAKDARRFPPETMRRHEGQTPQQIYMRRKIALGERKPN